MRQSPLQRHRNWLLLLVGVGLLVCLYSPLAMAKDVRIAYIGSTDHMAWRGVSQGLHEANILGRFIGDQFIVQPDRIERLATLSPPDLPVAVVVALETSLLLQLREQLAKQPLAIFNITRDDNQLRQRCYPNLLHIPPSTHMKADAIAQWQQKHPAAEGRVNAQAWHDGFKKFAARDLNKRFRNIQGVPMDDMAWAGWAAIKMIAETVARTQTTDSAQILSYLRTDLAFDGQKGVPHTFRDTGQLRQPLLMVQNGKLVGEAPVRGVVDSTNLDSLGLVSCKP